MKVTFLKFIKGYINETKKRKGIFCLCFVYGRFRSIIITTKARTMMIRTNSPAIAGTKYVSATEVAAVAVGCAVCDAGMLA